jgi:hypothetical protein
MHLNIFKIEREKSQKTFNRKKMEDIFKKKKKKRAISFTLKMNSESGRANPNFSKYSS